MERARTDDPVIRVRGLAVGYGSEAVLERLDFEVRRGERFLMLGPSGCGKTTVLRTLIGLQAPLSGELAVPGREEMLAMTAPPRFGVLFQSSALFGSMTVLQNVMLPLWEWTDLDPESIDLVARWKLRLVGLDGFEHHLPSEISGGMRKRAGIARALALDAELLFLDEPSAGLDPITAAALDDLILVLNQSLGVTMVIVTHELQSILRVGQRCVLFDRGERSIVAAGDPHELRENCEHPLARRFFRRETSPGRPREAQA
jgi:phospholipid/cholesterol/gamma-HCH transport system ATP-binding protein